jgi:hypothetical protein
MTKRPSGQFRPPTPASTPAMPRKSAEVERALALRDVMDHAVRVKREISEAKPIYRRRGSLFALLVCVPLLAFSVYSFVAKPEFIWGAPVALPPEQSEASGRVALFMLAQRIEAVRAQRGDYPESLTEIGEVAPGIQYTLVGDSAFELRMTPDATREIVFDSRANAREFLRNTPLTLSGSAR